MLIAYSFIFTAQLPETLLFPYKVDSDSLDDVNNSVLQLEDFEIIQ
jgi:hypothetical protein